MFRNCLVKGCVSLCIIIYILTWAPTARQAVASSSSSSSSSLLHTSGIRYANAKAGKLTPKAKLERKEKRWLKATSNRPSVLWGHRPDDEEKWLKCDLAKILVDEKELEGPPSLQDIETPVGTVHLPQQLAYGMSDAETTALLHDLPQLSSSVGALGKQTESDITAADTIGQKRELRKANEFAHAIDLRNADSGGIAYENRRRIILAFSSPENPFDTGRTEVQGECLFLYRSILPELF